MLCFPCAAIAGQSERVLTLEESITTGLHNSQELLGLKEQVSIAREMVKEAKGQIFPKIDFNLSMSRFDNVYPTVLAPSFNSMYLPAAQMNSFYSTRLSLWQYLYASGRYSTNLRLAETNLSQARAQADATQNMVILDVKNAFYACVITGEKIRAYESAISAMKTSGGNRWAYALSSMNLDLLKLKHDYEKQRLKFLRAVGLELNTVVELKGSLTAPTDEYELNKCLAWASTFRPELRQTQFQETIDSLKVNLSLAERYPTITLGANYERLGQDLPLDNTNWNATININLPIFDGWASWSRIRQRKHQAREGKIRRAKYEDDVHNDVMEALMDYNFWKERVDLMKNDKKQDTEPDKKLESELLMLETLQQALSSQAALEWAIGKAFFK